MKIASIAQIRSIEEDAIANGATADSLMEQAGLGIAQQIEQLYPDLDRAVVFLGSGNNAGDGFVAARHLLSLNWNVQLNMIYPPEKLGDLPRKKLEELRNAFPQVKVTVNDPAHEFANIPEIAIDALTGIGGIGPLRRELAAAVERLNHARRCSNLITISLDLPSGLSYAAEKSPADRTDENIAVVADITLTIAYAKDLLIREDLSHWVGRIEVVPLFDKEPNSEEEIVTARDLSPLLPRRSSYSHKGTYGRVAIVAGSAEMSGAAALCAKAAQRMGAGLIYLCVPQEIRAEVAARVPAEIMVRDNADAALLEKCNAIAIGPGLGTDKTAVELVKQVLSIASCPVVVDADALNVLAGNAKILPMAKSPLILTPHPGEMERLTGKKVEPANRPILARECANKNNVTLVLKGTRTIIAAPNEPLFYNTTGNPGLAAGGSGDILTGIITTLVAAGLKPWDAARLGVWLHGKAADIALWKRGCPEGLSATDVIDCLNDAIIQLRFW